MSALLGLSPDMKPSSKSQQRNRLFVVVVPLVLLQLGLVYYAVGSAGARNCKPSWLTASQPTGLRIALVSLSDAAAKRNATGPTHGNRNFQGILAATRENKEKYCAMHGYTYIDSSHLLDRSRPPSWSKILAVQAALKEYDWVFWIDADTLITRPRMALEEILPAGETPDYIVTKDAAGYNAGVWIIRRSEWTTAFLQKWWSMDSFIRRRPGDTKSGDNDALKHYLATMPQDEKRAHVGQVPQCSFNSYRWKPSLRNWLRYLRSPSSVSLGLHQPGDFLLHLAGVGNKLAIINSMLPTISYS